MNTDHRFGNSARLQPEIAHYSWAVPAVDALRDMGVWGTVGGEQPELTQRVNAAAAEERCGEVSAGHPLSERVALPEQVADVALFLASDGASFVNGAMVPVDSGWSAG